MKSSLPYVYGGNMPAGKIIRVMSESLAEELELTEGDKIIEINGQELNDIIDLSFAFADEEIDMLVEHEDGEQEMISFEKDYDEELGAEFESAVFDGIKRCVNNCCFCFVNQVPADMRSALYVKDDDYRLSFLYGNFVTMTNMTDADFKRIERLRLSPLFISVHTMNMELRNKLLGSKNGEKLIKQLDFLDDAGIEYHAQVVLCPELNDGQELDYTIGELLKRKDNLLSLAIVPVGLTKYRAACQPMRTFTPVEAKNVILQVEKWQKKLKKDTGSNMVYLGDEFYLLAKMPIPPASEYDDFPQLDNGIGLVRNFIEEWNEADDGDGEGYDNPLNLTVVCGQAVADIFLGLVSSLKVKNLSVKILPVENLFFGSSVNVSGLLTGRDIINALKDDTAKRDGVILPTCALRSGENIFLDDMKLFDVIEELSEEIKTALSGDELRYILTHWNEMENDDRSKTVYMWQSNAAYTKTEKWRDKDE